MDYIKLPLDYLDAIEPLGDAERGRLFTALMQYARTGEVPQLGGNERFLFPMMRSQIDKDMDNSKEISRVRSEAGKKGIKAKQANAKFDKQNNQMPDLQSVADFAENTPPPLLPPSPSSSSPPPYPPISNSSPIPPISPLPNESYAPARAKTAPPTLEQVQEVAKLRGCPECAKPFFDYYAAADWRDSEGKPCAWNWQQKLAAWQQREGKQHKKQQDKPWSYDPGETGGRSL